MVLVKTDLQKKNPDELVQFSITVEVAMKSNTKFATPTPTIAEVTAARELLEESIPPAAGGDRTAIALRNTYFRNLGTLLVRLCGYVNVTSDGDLDVARTSAFPPAKQPAPIGLVAPPVLVEVRATDKTGQVYLRIKSAHGSRMKQVFATSGDPNVETGWELIGVTTKSTFLATDLDPNKFYWFRVNAVCAAGESGYSDPAVCRAA